MSVEAAAPRLGVAGRHGRIAVKAVLPSINDPVTTRRLERFA